MPATSLPDVVIRPATSQDIPVCADICYRAFSAINAAHNFPSDVPVPEVASGIISACFSAPDFYCLVAESRTPGDRSSPLGWESDGRILGSNCLDERSIIHGVGPITVDPETQNKGVGRKLMEAVLERSRQRGAAGVRLVQAAFHNRSISLYASLGFDIREPIAVMQGRTRERAIPGGIVRPATIADLPACNSLSQRVHGFDRGTELAQAIPRGGSLVVERGGRITAYASHLAFFGHATAESNADLQALIASVDSFAGPGILVPSRNAELFRWCLSNGLRVVEPMTLMSMGLYNQPAGAFLPSVLF
ncbi:MAG TPA: GNAT family N-acetyltransferase [Terracidiphilus sp.]|nr:GNAT family N-acetyltransferase [Terracidiphilus sp.]